MMNFLTINDLLTSDRLPEEQMRLLLINSTDIAPDSERRAIANTILETAGDFLPTRDLMPFIKADISRKEAGDIILSQKKFIKGAAALFPEIVRLLGLSRIEDVKPVLHQIVDVCLDYPNILKSSHPKKRKRELAKSAHEVCQMIDSLNNALAQLDWHLDIEFSNHKAAQKRLFGPEFAAISHIWQLRNEISDLRFVAKLALLRESQGDELFYVGDNKAKTHIVECAYRLCLSYDGPSLLTTPGSDFSTLCTLIYELATAERDASLAGAINRFARSTSRRTLENEEQQAKWENSEEGIAAFEADNFSFVRGRIANLEAEREFWRQRLEDTSLNEHDVLQIATRLRDVEMQLDDQKRKHGPFLVWASQIPIEDREKWARELHENERKTLDLAVELGRKRRYLSED